jgi:hypothetical protein
LHDAAVLDEAAHMSERNGGPIASSVDGVVEKLAKYLAASIVHLVDGVDGPEHTVSVSRRTFKPAFMSSSDDPPGQGTFFTRASKRAVAEAPFVAEAHSVTSTSLSRSGVTRVSPSIQPRAS